jgi:AraC-like DNA-binding protein
MLVEAERIHLDPELSFAAFVSRMNAPERTVRRLVNQELGFDHFRTFLNHHRMAEARRLLADPGRSGDKLISVALDSGFASLPSFNRVFRETEGCTPSQYKESALASLPQPQADKNAQETCSEPGFEKRSAAF